MQSWKCLNNYFDWTVCRVCLFTWTIFDALPSVNCKVSYSKSNANWHTIYFHCNIIAAVDSSFIIERDYCEQHEINLIINSWNLIESKWNLMIRNLVELANEQQKKEETKKNRPFLIAFLWKWKSLSINFFFFNVYRVRDSMLTSPYNQQKSCVCRTFHSRKIYFISIDLLCSRLRWQHVEHFKLISVDFNSKQFSENIQKSEYLCIRTMGTDMKWHKPEYVAYGFYWFDPWWVVTQCATCVKTKGNT